MTTRNLIKDLIAGKQVKRCGQWIGNPGKDTLEIYCKELGIKNLEELQQYLGDDVRWITPHYEPSTYQHPEGKKMRYWKDANPHSMAGGMLCNASTIDEVEAFDWPETKYLDFSVTIDKLKNTGDYYRLSGFWTPFFHDLTYLLGTEDLLIKMYTHPNVVKAILDKLCGFYYKANEMFFKEAGNLIDALFFGNDFGSQNDLLIAPDQFEMFFLPWIQMFSEQAHSFGLQSVLHSCGSIYRIINQLADAGVDAIHPIQAQAYNMDAKTLTKEFQGKIAFVGGIDTQDILPNGTPEQIESEVNRVRKLLGPNIIIGPSHETLMPNVPLENILAMTRRIKN